MAKRRLLLGHILMIFGVLLPLVFFTQMAISHYRENGALKEFSEVAKPLTDQEQQWVETYEQEKEGSNPATTDPFVVGDDAQTPFEDQVIGYLKIAKIDLVQPIRVGASEYHLEVGVAQVSGTDLPFGGKGKRSVIAGHRSWYTDLRFFRLNELAAGDVIEIVLPDKTLIYDVIEQEVIDAEDWEQLLAKKGEDLLTLLTCEPIYPPHNYRLLINAKRRQETKVSVKVSSAKKKEVDKKSVNQSSSGDLLYTFVGIGWLVIAFLSYRLFLVVKEKKS